ncbi:hypothetical protein ALO77_101453 [Pseudomonas coronafaciens pv. garcae]|nr:hypothetical protein ALO77_101453 [Pseudomonas coronafaciens pv. garcae]RMS89828.1 hypothetical protein ALP57_101627 [Pseudomonas coronafaciens pv. oryzae]RMS90597.1 hypothetical protein ALP56_101472 [Pseudomonas coronafaciens pv. oryzae]RMV83656.1 hypothetical protein ALP02_101646 [Pseudomonas coronafaciens pv. garcae]
MKLIFAMLLMFSAYTFASCSSISDHDKRAYFEAKQGGGSCTTIKDHDLRAQCESMKQWYWFCWLSSLTDR